MNVAALSVDWSAATFSYVKGQCNETQRWREVVGATLRQNAPTDYSISKYTWGGRTSPLPSLMMQKRTRDYENMGSLSTVCAERLRRGTSTETYSLKTDTTRGKPIGDGSES